MIKPVWSTIKTVDGFRLKYPKAIKLAREELVSTFDEYSQISSIKSSTRQLGRNIIIKGKDDIKCVDIEVASDQRKNGFGKLLHAISVMLMRENKAKNIYLDALPEAIKFHHRSGFKTSASSSAHVINYMNSIIKSDTPFVDIKKTAGDILFDVSLNKPDVVSRANSLYDKFIESVFKNRISDMDANFPITLHMKLTMKDAKKQANIYNEVLNNFGIDYRI